MFYYDDGDSIPLREYLPLKQGLRHPISTPTAVPTAPESIFH